MCRAVFRPTGVGMRLGIPGIGQEAAPSGAQLFDYEHNPGRAGSAGSARCHYDNGGQRSWRGECERSAAQGGRGTVGSGWAFRRLRIVGGGRSAEHAV